MPSSTVRVTRAPIAVAATDMDTVLSIVPARPGRRVIGCRKAMTSGRASAMTTPCRTPCRLCST